MQNRKSIVDGIVINSFRCLLLDMLSHNNVSYVIMIILYSLIISQIIYDTVIIVFKLWN